jgi:hypothetical protein
MTRDDVLGFVNRDWALVARVKTDTWLRAKGSAAQDLAAADELRRHIVMLRPDWPGADESAADRQSHERVSRALGAVILRTR